MTTTSARGTHVLLRWCRTVKAQAQCGFAEPGTTNRCAAPHAQHVGCEHRWQRPAQLKILAK